MENFQIKYFLGANSCEGFVSVFGDCYDANDGWKAYIIKGGPGTGKSSFMKYAVAKAIECGIDFELCPCSSDPDSLDGVIFPDIKTVIMDGTAPHTVDPVYPGVCETILNFGQFWQSDLFLDNRQEILNVTNKNKQLHRSGARYIRALGSLMDDNLKIAAACTDKQKVNNFAKKLCQKHITKKGGKGKEWVRFLSGITPKGVVFYGKSIAAKCKTTIIIEDDYGNVADTVMRKVRDYSLNMGYEIVTVKNPFLPSTLIDHVIIPELSLCFVREYEYGHFDDGIRRIHARRFVNVKQLHKSRERLKFNKKAVRQLLLSACEVLKDAKNTHDELENYYIKAMDFKALSKFADSFCEELFRV